MNKPVCSRSSGAAARKASSTKPKRRIALFYKEEPEAAYEFDSPTICNSLLLSGAAALRCGVHHLHRHVRSEQQRHLRLPLQFEEREAGFSRTGGGDAAPVLCRVASEQALSL